MRVHIDNGERMRVGQTVSQVDTAALAKVGAAMEDDAAAFAKAHSSRAAALTCAGALTGWSSAPALAGTAQRWGAFLRQLTADVRTAGAGLTRSAAEFRATDEAAGNRITVAGHSPVRTLQ